MNLSLTSVIVLTLLKKTSLKHLFMFFFFVQTSGSLYLLADLKLLLLVSSGSAQTPLNQKKVEDP